MKANDVYRVLALAAGACLLAGAAVAQTTGRIMGSVSDEQKGVLPGVTVEARGPALQGSRATSTDQYGLYRLTLLPPGQYEVTFTLQGFATETRTGVTVSLARDTTLDLVMRPAVKESVLVSGEVPLVDVSSATVATNLTATSIQTLPTGRNYSAIVQVAPGVSSDAKPTTTSGRTRSRSTARPAPRTPSSSTASTRPASSTASRARSSTSSSSRRSTSRPAATRPSTAARPAASSTSSPSRAATSSTATSSATTTTTRSRRTPSPSSRPAARSRASPGRTTALDLGGYIVKDKLWFFGAYDRVDEHHQQRAARRARSAGQIVDVRRATATSAPPS